MGKFPLQIDLNVLDIVGFEVTIPRLMKICERDETKSDTSDKLIEDEGVSRC
jgi:hypothetical protein